MRILKAAMVAAAITPMLMTGAPANAATGAVVFAGTVALPSFPCNGCGAEFHSTVAAGAGVNGTDALVVTNLDATFTYGELCTNGQALDGTAEGDATLSGVGNPITIGFQWARTGLVAVITGSGGDTVVGAAVFVPTNGLPTCTGGPVNAVVAGAALTV